jgi:SAM-dependent methyltransferase
MAAYPSAANMRDHLSGTVDGVPERFVPAEMHGELVEAEHMARYRWASALCQGRRVLDAGCGLGYGADLLRQTGATEVLAVDVSEAVIEAAEAGGQQGVVWEVADLRSLPYTENSFDVVVCFEVIEHIEEQDRVLDELSRVLRADGLLLISSPNRGRYVPGNPHHRHEYVPSELRAALEGRFEEVRLFPQHAMLASVIGPPGEFHGDCAHVERLVEPGNSDEIYTLAIAGRQLPEASAPTIALTQFLEIRRWLERYDEQDRVVKEQESALRELETVRLERNEALVTLAWRERDLAELPGLREQIGQADAAVSQMQQEILAVRDELTHASLVMDEMCASISWRVTAPLRGLKRRVRGTH